MASNEMQLDLIREELARHCPTLVARQVDSGAEIRGSHVVRSLDGRELDRFSIQVFVPSTFPQDLPEVFETGNRIPISGDAHKFKNGQCCIGVPAALWKHLGHAPSLSAFLLGPMADYFLGQALVAVGKEWPGQEAS